MGQKVTAYNKESTELLWFQGYFNSLRNERIGERGGREVAITMLCPGPVFSNVLGESFTENPGQVNRHVEISIS